MTRLKGVKKLARRVSGKEGLAAFAERCQNEMGISIGEIPVEVDPACLPGQILARTGQVVLTGIIHWDEAGEAVDYEDPILVILR